MLVEKTLGQGVIVSNRSLVRCLLFAYLSLMPAHLFAQHDIVVRASDTLGDSVEAQVSNAPNTVIALVQATSQCEAKRALRGISARCEPVAYNGETITTAKELRKQALLEDQRLSLFRIVQDDAIVYLYGSVHMMKDNMYPLDPVIMQAFESSDALALEVDLAKIGSKIINAKFRAAGLLPKQQSLSGVLSEETLQLLQKHLNSRGLGIESYARMRPWMFEQSFIAQEMMLYGYGAAAGIDAFFAGRARIAGKQIFELETLDQQLALVSSSTLKEQDQSLLFMLEALSKNIMQEEVNSLVMDWLQGDIAGIYASMMEPIKEYPALAPFMKRMFEDRNQAMTDKITRWIKAGGRYFVVVGAGHLGGDVGLVSLLKNQGLTVQQLTRK